MVDHTMTPSPVTVVPNGPSRLFGVGGHAQVGWETSCSQPVGPHLRGPDGRTAVGGLGVVVDEALGYAVMSGLGPGAWSISTEIWIDLLGGALPQAGSVRAEAASAQHGSFAVGSVVDGDGTVLASCRQRGRRVDFDPSAVEPPVVSEVRRTDDIVEFLSMELTEDGAALMVEEKHVNPRGLLHGGVSLAVCEVAATASRVRAGSTLATTSVHVVHTRPVPLGSEVEVVVRTRHAGRSLWLADVDAQVSGRLCASLRVSAQEVPPTAESPSSR